MSKYHFLRTFESIIGATPMEYRNNIRLQHAADLLLEEKLAVEQISALVGYSSASYFSSAFKQKYGLSPKQYQNRK
jgi:AraC-like DNA-binding protein